MAKEPRTWVTHECHRDHGGGQDVIACQEQDTLCTGGARRAYLSQRHAGSRVINMRPLPPLSLHHDRRIDATSPPASSHAAVAFALPDLTVSEIVAQLIDDSRISPQLRTFERRATPLPPTACPRALGIAGEGSMCGGVVGRRPRAADGRRGRLEACRTCGRRGRRCECAWEKGRKSGKRGEKMGEGGRGFGGGRRRPLASAWVRGARRAGAGLQNAP